MKDMTKVNLVLLIMFCIVDTILGITAIATSGHPGMALTITLIVMSIHGLGAVFTENEND